MSIMQADEEKMLLDGPLPVSVHTRRQIVIRHLPYFLVVAQEQHFLRAALRMNITQSALSRRIQSLENELGVSLFERLQRGVVLTQAGLLLQQDSEQILQDLERSVGRIHALMRGEEGRLRIGLNEGAARCGSVTTALRQFRDANPKVHIELFSMLSDEQIEALRSDALDLAFVYGLSQDVEPNDPLERHLVDEEPMMLAVYDGHPLASQEVITISDLRHEKLAWPSRIRGRHIFDRMIATFDAAGISPHIALEVMTAEMTVSMVAAHLVLGFVPLKQHRPDNVILRNVEGFHVPMRLYLTRPRSTVSYSGARFFQFVQDSPHKI